jgi:molybdate transport system ATP-binding protein
MADRLIVLEHGRILQSGSATEITERPRSRYVADLVGVNLFRGRATANHVELAGGGSLALAEAASGEVFAMIHPRMVSLYRQRPNGTPRNTWPGRARDLDLQGDRVRVRLEGSPSIVAEVTASAVKELGLDTGQEVWIAVKATEIVVYPA